MTTMNRQPHDHLPITMSGTSTTSATSTTSVIIDALDERGLTPLLDEICRLRAVTREAICSSSRTRAVASARHELWWRLRHHRSLAFSFMEIGHLFHRTHATILHGVRAHTRRLTLLSSLIVPSESKDQP